MGRLTKRFGYGMLQERQAKMRPCFETSPVFRSVMMKKVLTGIFVLGGVMLLSFPLYAQVKASVSEHLATNFSSTAMVTGLEANFSRFDLLVEISFQLSDQTEKYTNYLDVDTDNTQSGKRADFFAGVAAKTIVSEKWTVSIPIFAKISYGRSDGKFNDAQFYVEDMLKTAVYFGYGFSSGPRIHYSLTKNFDVYAGFLVDMFFTENLRRVYWKTGPNDTYIVESDTDTYFGNTEFSLGIRYKM
jgi:hypothetical protein